MMMMMMIQNIFAKQTMPNNQEQYQKQEQHLAEFFLFQFRLFPDFETLFWEEGVGVEEEAWRRGEERRSGGEMGSEREGAFFLSNFPFFFRLFSLARASLETCFSFFEFFSRLFLNSYGERAWLL